MKRFGWVARVKPEQYDEYKRLHADVWPDVLETISACNLRNYSIFHRDGQLFTYVEYTGDDFAADMAKMADDETTRDWWDLVIPMFEDADPDTPGGNVWADMEEIFHLE